MRALTMMRGRTVTSGTAASSPAISFETLSRPSNSQPRASASACVQSPTTPVQWVASFQVSTPCFLA